MEAKALAALVPAMAAAQKELSHDLAGWLAKLGPNAIDQKFTPAHLKQIQTLLGVAQAKASLTGAGYPYASFPMVAAKAVQDAMGKQMPQKLAAQTLEGQLVALHAKFADLPSPQLVHAALIAKGDHMVVNQFKNSSARYAGQVGQDLKFQFGVGLAKGETIQQLTKRIAGLSGFQKAVDASHPQHAGGAMAGGLTKRYHNWAQRLVRTELNQAYNKTALDGIKVAHTLDDRIVMMWDATNDMRVCLYCRALHGKKAAPGKSFPGGHMQPPAHPNCRCALVSWMEDAWDDGEVPVVPSAEEVAEKEKLTQKQHDEGVRRGGQRAEAQAAAKEDLKAYDQHKQDEQVKAIAAQQAAAKAKADAEAAAYQKMLAEKKAAEEAAKAKLLTEQAAAKAAADAAAKKLAAEAKKAAAALKAETGAAKFDPVTSGQLKFIPSGKKKGQAALLSKPGMVLVDKDTIKGHGYEVKWQAKDAQWVTKSGPMDAGFKFDYTGSYGAKGQWVPMNTPPKPVTVPTPAAKAAQVVAAAPPVKASGPMPMAIKGYEWKDVGGQWTLHKGDVPASSLVPAWTKNQHTKGIEFQDSYTLGADLASKGMVTTGLGKMEGYGFTFEKNTSTGQWEKTSITTPTGTKVPYVKPAPAPSASRAPTPPPAPVGWKPTPIKLAPNRKGVTDFDAHPTKEFHGKHGRGFAQDGDVIEGGSVRVLKVTDSSGNTYFETNFKVTHPYGAAATTYGTGQGSQWTYNSRTLTGGVLKDSYGTESVYGRTNIHKDKDHTVEVGTAGALKNSVRIRAKSLAELNNAMDRFGEHLGADLRKPPTKEDLLLHAKARIAAKYDPAEFGRSMRTAGATADQQRANIEAAYEKVLAKYPKAAAHLKDVEEVEVYPGHKALYSKSLGKEIAAQFPTMTHTGSPPAAIAADIVSETGLMSSAKRYATGTFTTGMSTSTDFETGGADGVFMRLNSKEKEHHTSSGGSGFKLILDTEKVMGRLDWWAFNEDNYGRSSYDQSGSRWAVKDMKRGRESGSNEVMAPQGIPPSAIKLMICKNADYRNEVLATLKARGVTKINGMPVEQVVVVSK